MEFDQVMKIDRIKKAFRRDAGENKWVPDPGKGTEQHQCPEHDDGSFASNRQPDDGVRMDFGFRLEGFWRKFPTDPAPYFQQLIASSPDGEGNNDSGGQQS